MEFKSQICTTREQSEKLLALGLKKETADMSWFKRSINANFECCTSSYTEWVEEILPIVDDYTLKDIIPAWSLSRLIEICEPIPVSSDWLYRTNAYYENMIACIAWRINKDSFNPQFLEEKK